MAGLVYVLDTNAVSDYLGGFQPTTEQIRQALRDGDTVVLCEPVEYEVMRGLLKVNATRKQKLFQETFAPALTRVPLTPEDWALTAHYWAQTRNQGRQLSDMDLLIAAITTRLGGVLVSADADFNALPITRENWRETA
jgi:predicted nucleic acid-binding protein